MWLLNSEISFTGFTLKVINKQRFTNKQLWFALKPVIRHGRTVNSNMMDAWLCLKNLCCFHVLSGLADEVEGNVAGKTISLFHIIFFYFSVIFLFLFLTLSFLQQSTVPSRWERSRSAYANRLNENGQVSVNHWNFTIHFYSKKTEVRSKSPFHWGSGFTPFTLFVAFYLNVNYIPCITPMDWLQNRHFDMS